MGRRKHTNLHDEFFAKVNKQDDCWLWTSRIGTVRVNGKNVTARHAALELAGIEVQKRGNGYFLTCGNNKCVRPEHLVPDTLEFRFWKNVKKTETCWLWIGPVHVTGYGLHGRRRRIRDTLAHRISWCLEYGTEIPAELAVCHHCDTPRCVRPSHLFLGTIGENNRDCLLKGRKARGTGTTLAKGNGKAKLTEVVIPEIRRRLACGESRAKIGRSFGVSSGCIKRIEDKTTWTHVP